MRAGHAVLGVVVALSAMVFASSCASDARPARTDAPPAIHPRGVGAGGLPGEPVAADTLANTRIGGPYGTVLAFRFRARWTGEVRAVRFYAVLNSDGREGYSGGTGGTLRIAVTRDSGAPAHVPTSGSLATATLAPPKRDAWPQVRFNKPAHVVAGRYYHVVFTNADRNPESNYISVNALLSYGDRGPAPRGPDGMAVLLGSTSDGGRTPRGWEPRAEGEGQRYMPILEVAGSGGTQRLGVGYMEVWSSNPKPIGGAAQVRQLLGGMGGKTISGAWLRVRRRPGGSAPLQLRISKVDGGVLRSATVPAGRVDGAHAGWVHVRFSSPVAIKGGDELALTASSSQSAAFEAFPIRKGTEFGFSSRTVFDGGYAQFTDNGAWVGWDQWGGHDLHTGDLQFMLDLGR